MMLSSRRRIAAHAFVLATVFFGSTAAAADLRWLGGTGAWTSANWSGGAFPNSFADIARIDDGAAPGSSVTLDATVEIGGIAIDAGDRLSVGTGTLVMRGTLANAGQLSIAGGGTLALAGHLILSGSGETLITSGVTGGRIRAHAFSNTAPQPPVLTIAAGHVLRGSGSVGAGSHIVNDGTIVAEGADPLILFTNANHPIANNGRVEVRDGAWLLVDSSLGGAVHATGAATIWGELRNVTFSGTLAQQSYTGLLLTGTFTGLGATLRVGDTGSSQRSLRLASNQSGSPVLAGTGQIVLENGAIDAIFEAVTIGAGQTVRTTHVGTISANRVLNLGRIEVAEAARLTTSRELTRLENRGALVIETGGTAVLQSAVLAQDAAAAVTQVRGRLEIGDAFMPFPPPVVNVGFDLTDGTLAGDGSLAIAGFGLRQSGGTIAPGTSIGKLAIDLLGTEARFTQLDDALLVFELNGPLPGISHDQIAISGGAGITLNGRVRVSFGYAPSVGDHFDVLVSDASLFSGTFDAIEAPAGMLLVPTYAADRVTLTVAVVPEPHTYALMLAGLGLVAWMIRHRRRCSGSIRWTGSSD